MDESPAIPSRDETLEPRDTETADQSTDLDLDELDAANLADDDPAPEELAPEADEPYLNRIRRQAASARTRAREAEARADSLARELWSARVAALGLLADPSDLPYDPELLADPDGISAAVAELLAAKPHLRRRQITGGLGQASPADTPSLSLAEILRANA